MLRYTLKYAARTGLRQVMRYPGRFFSAVLGLGILCFFFSLGAWLVMNIQRSLSEMGDAYHASAYLKVALDAPEVQTLGEMVCNDPRVAACHWRTQDEAKKRFLEKNPDLADAFEALEANPLPASLEIDLSHKYRRADLVAFVNELSAYPTVEQVTSSLTWLLAWQQGMAKAWTYFRILGLLIVFLVGSMLMNTVSQLVLLHKDELDIMTWMGANRTSQMLPYMLIAACVALLSGLWSGLLTYALHLWSLKSQALAFLAHAGSSWVFFSPGALAVATTLLLGFAVLAAWASCYLLLQRIR